MSDTPVVVKGGAMIVPALYGDETTQQGGMKVKTIKRKLKKLGLSTKGRKSTLIKRLRTKKGGEEVDTTAPVEPVEPVKEDETKTTGSGHRKMTVKQMKKLLKANGHKTSGKTKRSLSRLVHKHRLA